MAEAVGLTMGEKKEVGRSWRGEPTVWSMVVLPLVAMASFRVSNVLFCLFFQLCANSGFVNSTLESYRERDYRKNGSYSVKMV